MSFWPVRQRIADLERAGWTRSRIATTAGVSAATITRSTRWCTRVVARNVLALAP